MRTKNDIAEKKKKEWEKFVKKHRHVFEKIAKNLEKKGKR